jgi:ubiquitin-like protein Pup
MRLARELLARGLQEATVVKREHKQGPKRRRLPRVPVPEPGQVLRDRRRRRPGEETRKELEAELDELLDEIDEALEENAEEFVRGYVQKSGE